MSGEYEHMGTGELLARLGDWMQVATDRGTRIVELEAERDRLRAVVEQALSLGETDGMARGKMPYPDWWVLLDRALDPRERQLDVSPITGDDDG